MVDQHGAALLAMGVLAALLRRERTGEAQKVGITMLQSALDLQSEPLMYYLNGGRVERPRPRLRPSSGGSGRSPPRPHNGDRPSRGRSDAIAETSGEDSAGEPELRRLPPSLGENTEEVLKELGYSAEGIARMRDRGIV